MRRARPSRWPAVLLAAGTVVAACGGGSEAPQVGVSAGTTQTPVPLTSSVGDLRDQLTETAVELQDVPVSSGGWSELPEAPIPARAGAAVAVVGSEVVVFGGADAVCPPGADCDILTPRLTSAAALDLETLQWRVLADAPVAVDRAQPVVLDGLVYALSNCLDGPLCPGGPVLLRYDVAGDDWTVLPAPPRDYYGLATVGDRLIAYRGSDEGGPGSDYRFDEVANQWLALPDDPLPAVFDRFVVDHDGELLLFGSLIGGESKLVASFDFSTSTWTARTPGPRGYQAWGVGDVVYLNAHFGPEGGGIYVPDTDEWMPFPAGPADETWRGDAAGVISARESVFSYSSGWVLDVVGDSPSWTYVEDRPLPEGLIRGEGASVVAVPLEGATAGVLVFGGFDFTSDLQTLAAPTWLWTY